MKIYTLKPLLVVLLAVLIPKIRQFYVVSIKHKVTESIALSVITVVFLTACSSQRFPVSDHSNGSIFYNEDLTARTENNFFDILKWKLGSDPKEWPENLNDNLTPDFTQPLKNSVGAVTFINHATEFVQFEKLNLITDPVFSERVSPFSWIGPKRHRKPGASIAELPKVDLVVLSHNHFDHMDIPSLVAIDKKDSPTFIVPLGNKKYLEDNGIQDVVELDWWQHYSTKDGSVITLVPMQHWSTRGLFDRFEALWGGYVIESSGLKVLFAGDTGYNRHFKEVEAKFGSMDLSLLPIGAYEPRWLMKDQHMNPTDAIQAHVDLKSKLSVGMHFGTFQLTDEGIEEPVTDLAMALAAEKLDPSEFLAPKNGQTILFGGAQ